MIHPHLLELELLTLWSRLWSFHTSLPWPSLLPFVFVVFEASLYLLCPHGRSSCYAMSSGRLVIAFLPVAPSCPLHIYIVETHRDICTLTAAEVSFTAIPWRSRIQLLLTLSLFSSIGLLLTQ